MDLLLRCGGLLLLYLRSTGAYRQSPRRPRLYLPSRRNTEGRFTDCALAGKASPASTRSVCSCERFTSLLLGFTSWPSLCCWNCSLYPEGIPLYRKSSGFTLSFIPLPGTLLAAYRPISLYCCSLLLYFSFTPSSSPLYQPIFERNTLYHRALYYVALYQSTLYPYM